MKDKEIEQVRQDLLRHKSELEEMEEMSSETGKTVELDQTRVGRLSRMDAMQAQQMALESARRRQRQLLKINGALLRIEASEYGYCYVCGEEIDARRLFADPSNTRCVKCME